MYMLGAAQRSSTDTMYVYYVYSRNLKTRELYFAKEAPPKKPLKI